MYFDCWFDLWPSSFHVNTTDEKRPRQRPAYAYMYTKPRVTTRIYISTHPAIYVTENQYLYHITYRSIDPGVGPIHISEKKKKKPWCVWPSYRNWCDNWPSCLWNKVGDLTYRSTELDVTFHLLFIHTGVPSDPHTHKETSELHTYGINNWSAYLGVRCNSQPAYLGSTVWNLTIFIYCME